LEKSERTIRNATTDVHLSASPARPPPTLFEEEAAVKKALFALSGDPIHNGHIDIVNRTTNVFDRVIVGIGLNPDKGYLFSPEERMEMARRSVGQNPGVEVACFEGLLVDYAYEQGARVIVKGIRNSNDFDYENILHQVGESQELGIDTYVLFARPELMHVSSTMIKALQKEEGFIHRYVPLYVKQCLEERISGQFIVGVTGEIGTGKSSLGQVFRALGKSRKIEVHPIEMDDIGTQILETREEPSYHRVRERLAEAFGSQVRNPDGTIHRKALGEIVYRDYDRLNELNRILEKPLMVRLRRELRGKKGLVLLNAALLAESALTHLCNNHVILVSCDKKSQEKRLRGRGLDRRQIERRLASQYSEREKREKIQARIHETNQGRLWFLDASDATQEQEFSRVFDQILDFFGLGRS
jgi:pantetheine-phosphate adenylyltransferase